MTIAEFRVLALKLPEAVESAHMGHPDFRGGGKVFATLGVPDSGHGMVKLTSEQQAEFVAESDGGFIPVPGGWGAKGATRVVLELVGQEELGRALATAWRNTAPKRLLRSRPE